MSQSRPSLKTPSELIKYLSTETNPSEINHLLKSYRENDYAENLKKKCDPDDVIACALTTDNINTLSYVNLELARESLDKKDRGYDTKRVKEALDIILKAKDATINCGCEATKKEFYDSLKKLDNNPLINLSKLCVSDANLCGVKLRYADLSGVKFCNVKLDGADLRNVNLRDATLFDVSLTDACLDGIDARWANLQNCNLDREYLNVGLQKYLQVKLPSSSSLTHVPTVNEFKKVLDNIEKEFELEKINEHVYKHKVENSCKNNERRKSLAKNIVTLSELLSDDKLSYDLVKLAVNHPIYANHKDARLVGFLNKKVNKIHHFFHENGSDYHFGTFNQNILNHRLNELECKLRQDKVNVTGSPR